MSDIRFQNLSTVGYAQQCIEYMEENITCTTFKMRTQLFPEADCTETHLQSENLPRNEDQIVI